MTKTKSHTTLASAMPEGPRDTTEWYTGVDPLAIVDENLLAYVREHAGSSILDLGCGTGGYSKRLQDDGCSVQALDVNEEYVKIAQSLGVAATHFDGQKIPLPDNAVETTFLFEVLEHVPEPGKLLSEIRRVTAKNVIISVPNCTFSFDPAPVTFSHNLELDHKNFFTKPSLRQLLSEYFPFVHVAQIEPWDRSIVAKLLPRTLFYAYRLVDNLRLIKPRVYFRLLAEARLED
jgi:SAM-dependent methyltransferase